MLSKEITRKIHDKARDKLASKFLVQCGNCMHGIWYNNDCPHRNEALCTWQRELADDSLSLSGDTDGYEWEIGVHLKNEELPRWRIS
jgi:hypothetical protein